MIECTVYFLVQHVMFKYLYIHFRKNYYDSNNTLVYEHITFKT
jgi:hypothetical protein